MKRVKKNQLNFKTDCPTKNSNSSRSKMISKTCKLNRKCTNNLALMRNLIIKNRLKNNWIELLRGWVTWRGYWKHSKVRLMGCSIKFLSNHGNVKKLKVHREDEDVINSPNLNKRYHGCQNKSLNQFKRLERHQRNRKLSRSKRLLGFQRRIHLNQFKKYPGFLSHLNEQLNRPTNMDFQTAFSKISPNLTTMPRLKENNRRLIKDKPLKITKRDRKTC